MREIYKEIKETDGRYLISNFGNVMSAKGKLRKLRKTNGYLDIAIHFKDGEKTIFKSFLIHRLVATYFIENIHNKPCINHKDGKRDNNHFTNLEWVTYSENNQHSVDFLGRKGAENIKRRKMVILTNSIETKKILGIRAAARFLNVSYQNVQNSYKNGHLCCGYSVIIK